MQGRYGADARAWLSSSWNAHRPGSRHFREYLVRNQPRAWVLAMAKRTRLGDVDFAEIGQRGQHGLIPRGG